MLLLFVFCAVATFCKKHYHASTFSSDCLPSDLNTSPPHPRGSSYETPHTLYLHFFLSLSCDFLPWVLMTTPVWDAMRCTSHPHELSCETSHNLFLALQFLSYSSLYHPPSPRFAVCDVHRKHKFNSFPVIAFHRVWLAPLGALCQKSASRICIKMRQLQTRIAQAILRGVHRRFVCNKCYRSGGRGFGQRITYRKFRTTSIREKQQSSQGVMCFKKEPPIHS